MQRRRSKNRDRPAIDGVGARGSSLTSSEEGKLDDDDDPMKSYGIRRTSNSLRIHVCQRML
jgi:hypothetical protein